MEVCRKFTCNCNGRKCRACGPGLLNLIHVDVYTAGSDRRGAALNKGEGVEGETAGEDYERGEDPSESVDEDGEEGGGDAGEGAGRTQPRVFEADPMLFSRVLLSADMLNDHLPDSYLAAVNQL